MQNVDDAHFAIVDVETTGGSAMFNRIIEIGILRIEQGQVVESYETLLNPGAQVSEFITNMTGISSQDLASAPAFEDVQDTVERLLKDSIFVAHNASFDYSFLSAEFSRVGKNFTTDMLCTVQLSRALYPEHKRHNLSEIIERFSLDCPRRHRAMDDARVLWDFMNLLSKTFPQNKIHSEINRLVSSSVQSQQKKRGFIAHPITYQYNSLEE